MIRDLTGAGSVRQETDVCVIGGGTVGLILTALLARAGRGVICVESGDREQRGAPHPLNEVEHAGPVRYAGASEGRFRCLGGTSTRWGGALIPFLDQDMRGAGWPIGSSDLEPYLSQVEGLFGLRTGPYEDPSLTAAMGGSHVARLAKWPAFRRRNTYALLSAELAGANGPSIWINATATRFHVSNGELESVQAQAPSGSTLEVRARHFILAAGAIESTRLLLLLDRQNDACVSSKCTSLGLHFHDHLSTVIADVEVRDRKALNRIVGFRFERGGSMRNLRFELAEHGDAHGFVHIGFEQTGEGFLALRELLRALQQRSAPTLSAFAQLVRSAPWIAQAVWWRFLERRLLFPDGAKLQAHLVLEQYPDAENRICLSDGKRDAFGQPLARIEWAVRPIDQRRFGAAAARFSGSWNESSLGKLAVLHARAPELIAASLKDGGGVFHPGGTTRMAQSPEGGVVNSDLEVFGVRNLRVLATSVLPSGGGANPTMTLLLLAHRCVDQLADSLRRFGLSGRLSPRA